MWRQPWSIGRPEWAPVARLRTSEGMKMVTGTDTGKRSKREVFSTRGSPENAFCFKGLQLGDVCELKYNSEHF
jgi:hypothetical protein